MMSDSETYCEIASEDLKKKLPEDQKLSKLCSEARLNLVEVGQFFFALPSPNGAKNQSPCREYTLLPDEKENCAKGWIQSDARFGPVSDKKVCKSHGRSSVEIYVPSLFKGQTKSWINIVNSVEKYVRQAMPIQEEERASVKLAAKARPRLVSSSTSNYNFIPMKQRKWIDIEVKKIQGPLLLPDVTIHWSITSAQGSWSRRR